MQTTRRSLCSNSCVTLLTYLFYRFNNPFDQVTSTLPRRNSTPVVKNYVNVFNGTDVITVILNSICHKPSTTSCDPKSQYMLSLVYVVFPKISRHQVRRQIPSNVAGTNFVWAEMWGNQSSDWQSRYKSADKKAINAQMCYEDTHWHKRFSSVPDKTSGLEVHNFSNSRN